MPTKDHGLITLEDIERWNRCVYEPNRERVEEYRRMIGTQEASADDYQPGHNANGCCWCQDEICVNANCPMRGDYCLMTD